MAEFRFMQGNEAVSEGAIAAGVRFFAGYPITPATEIAEYMSRRLPQVKGTFIQMEDELGSLAATLGASVGGVKAMTATSGPGMSLYGENLGQSIVGEIPCLIVNVQRTGPGTGSVTPSQQDMMQAKWGTHGDATGIALVPSSVQEAYDLAIKGVNLAERFRAPVTVLMDTFVGHLKEKVRLRDPGELPLVERSRPDEPPESYKCYRPDERGVPPMADFGNGYRSKILGNMHDEAGRYSRDPKVFDALIRRLRDKILDYPAEYESVEQFRLEDAETAIFAYGTTSRAAKAAVRMARDKGMRVGLVRPVTVWPFPEETISMLADRIRHFLVIEMNLGQIVLEVRRAVCGRARVSFLGDVGGVTIRPGDIFEKLHEVL
jgi:2-oxoglutarate/2-oxoacid ferredoxin oxidoreductase subunit alpha